MATVTVELFGGPKDGTILELPSGKLELRVAIPSQLTLTREDAEHPHIAVEVGLYRATSIWRHGCRVMAWLGPLTSPERGATDTA